MENSLPDSFNWRPVIVNAAVCGIIGGAFGTVSRNLIPWLAGGLVVGGLLGLATEASLGRLSKSRFLYRRRLLLLVLVEALLTVYLVIPALGAYHDVHPPRSPVSFTPAELGMAYEDVTLTTEDGVNLSGWYIPSQNGAAIVAVHGLAGNRTQVLGHAQALAEAGYGVLLFDLRAHGESGGQRFGAAYLDVRAAVEYLLNRPEVMPEQIGALGLSAGAHAILNAAAGDPRLKALWLDGAGANRVEDVLGPMLPELRPFFIMMPVPWMHDRFMELFSGVKAAPPLKEQVAKIVPRPMLFVAGGQEDLEISLAHRYADIAGKPARVWGLPDVAHCGGLAAYPEEYKGLMLSFFDTYLRHTRSTGE